MTPLKLLTALPLIALTAGCVAGDGTQDDLTQSQELERNLETDLDGDGSVTNRLGVEYEPVSD